MNKNTRDEVAELLLSAGRLLSDDMRREEQEDEEQNGVLTERGWQLTHDDGSYGVVTYSQNGVGPTRIRVWAGSGRYDKARAETWLMRRCRPVGSKWIGKYISGVVAEQS